MRAYSEGLKPTEYTVAKEGLGVNINNSVMNSCFMTDNGDTFRCSEPNNTYGIKLWTKLIATMRDRARQATENPDEDVKQSPRACFDAM